MHKLFSFLFVLFLGCAAVGWNGTFSYRGNVIHWQRQDFPLMVSFNGNVSPERRDITEDCLLTWNDAVERTVFIVGLDEAFGAPVEITVGDAEDALGRRTLAETSLRWTPDEQPLLYRAVTTIDVATRNEDARLVILHEMGHVLGLSHDSNWRNSIMYDFALSSRGHIMQEDINFIRWQMDN